MAGSIKLAAPSGGSVTLNAVDTASNFVMSVPAVAGILINADSATGAAQLPVGTTAQRPASPVTGQTRFNTTTTLAEVYNGTAWVAVGGYVVSYLVVAGGGGAGNYGGGGGAGGLLSNIISLNGGTAYTVTVGAGGTGNSGDGSNSVFGSITATGGGGGGNNGGASNGRNGGSGGGASNQNAPFGTIGLGTAGQGNNGALGSGGGATNISGGGGGYNAVGSGPNGGAGGQFPISGSFVFYAGGGAGVIYPSSAGTGGVGGGGGYNTAGTANTGGGSGSNAGASPNGGSGIVIVSYPSTVQRATGGTVTSYTANSLTYWVHTFTTSGTFTA